MEELFTNYVWPLLLMVLQSLLLLIILLITIAYVLLADRKIWAAVQMRRGPNVVGPFGLLQSFADLLKFVLKEPTIPAGANKGVFLLAPLVTCILALSEPLGHKLPYDSAAQLRQALFKAHPHLARIDQITPGDAGDIGRLAALGGLPDKTPFAALIDDFYLTNPIARASAIMAECSVIAEGYAARAAAE